MIPNAIWISYDQINKYDIHVQGDTQISGCISAIRTRLILLQVLNTHIRFHTYIANR